MGTRIRNDPNHIFELFCEVGIPSTSTQAPWIAWKFPQSYKDEETLKSLPGFAYPVEFNNNAVHHFSFVLTNVESTWTFGFCRFAPNSPTCFVILSYLPWHETFYRVLNNAAELSNKGKPGSSKELQSFLEILYKTQIPDPGLELHVSYGENEEFVAVCPDHNKLPSIPENRNMTEYFNAVDAHNMMSIFASMLHERRILVTSKKLSRLSACVQAANALIYPMHWQHIFIPILPKHLLDYLSAPMPFLIGVPSSTLSRVKQSDMGDIILLDADNNKVESPYADLDALPTEVIQSLRHDLKRPHEMLGDCVARAFLKASVKLIGGYWNALKLKPGEKISFSPELFIQTRPAPMQPFLEKMLQLQIFQQFIECRLKMLNSGQGVSDEFEFELTAHEDKTSTRLHNQYKDWVFNMKKEGGAFFKNVKTKVKDTGKKAYKDIRSRIHDIHHHKAIHDNEEHNFRKRGSSVPTLFTNGFDVELNGNKNANKKENLTSTKSKDHQNNLYTTLQEAADVTTGTTVENSSVFDSPQLTFQPIDMDLMGDLHELIFPRCSLCSDKVQQRNSISDPQLIDLALGDQIQTCRFDCPSRLQHSRIKKETSVSPVPPPLLPRPPITKTPVKNGAFHSSNSSSDSSVPLQKPLIELDGEVFNESNINSDVFSVPHPDHFENDDFAGVSKSYLTSDNRTVNKFTRTTNPFSASLLTKKLDCLAKNSSQNEYVLPEITLQSSNPFNQSSESISAPSQPFSVYKCSSGPNVRNMVNMWQSPRSSSKNQSLSSSAEKLKSTIPVISPYRSQPLSRTLSTPPAFSNTGYSLSSNVVHSMSKAEVPRNPFVAMDNKPDKIAEENANGLNFTSKSATSSWENFH